MQLVRNEPASRCTHSSSRHSENICRSVNVFLEKHYLSLAVFEDGGPFIPHDLPVLLCPTGQRT
jgi:hypothetical protein